jgi:hypothetical protein
MTTGRAQTPLVGPGSSYTNIFSPASDVTFDVPGGGLLSITLSNGSTTQSSGIWDLTAQGGANANILFIGLLESGAQTQLTGSTLKFNVSNDNDSLLGLLGVGTSIHYGWEATAYFDTPGSVLGFSDLNNYHISFDVDGDNGLLDSVAGLNPSLSFELIDGLGNSLASDGNGSLINVAGLLGGLTSGTVNLDYNVIGSVPSGPVGIRFRGDATVGATALGLGTDFATISNVSITATPIPEPTGMLLIAVLGAVSVLARHRRPQFA